MIILLPSVKSQTEADGYNNQYLLAYLSHVSSRKDFQVGSQCTGLQNTAVFLLIVRFSKQNVVTQGGVLYPGLLRYVCDRTLKAEGRKQSSYYLENSLLYKC